jgi:hypothetical protein
MFRRVIVIASALLTLASITAAQSTSGSAVITGVSTAGTGYATYTANSSGGYDGDVGRWDTPYTGHDPSLEPSGTDTLYIDIDVNAGGTLLFDYSFETYDAGIYDWLDLSLETPMGTQWVVQNYGKPGSLYGTYWSSPPISIALPLDPYANQHVRLAVSVRQDGYGDQTVTHIRNLTLGDCSSSSTSTTPSMMHTAVLAAAPACKPCSVQPLAQITDPDALAFENGKKVDLDHLTTEMMASVDCFIESVTGEGGTISITSAWRPVAYQEHLRETWDKWDALKSNTAAECQKLKQTIGAHFASHGLLLSQQPSINSKHTQGLAIDANVALPAGVDGDALAGLCSLSRPKPKNDPVHYTFTP